MLKRATSATEVAFNCPGSCELQSTAGIVADERGNVLEPVACLSRLLLVEVHSCRVQRKLPIIRQQFGAFLIEGYRRLVAALGMKLFSPSCPASATTAVIAPDGVDSSVVVKELKSRFGAIIANGQGEMKGKIFRIAHLGYFDYLDTIALIGALEQVIAKSFPSPAFAFGNGLIAAQKVFAERSPTAAADACCCAKKSAK